jgi:hypothetical protein
MFRAPKNIYGPNLMRTFVQEMGGPQKVAKFLQVTERTVFRWLEKGKVPRAAVLALYWETQYGRSAMFTDQVNEIRSLYRQVHLLHGQYARAKDIVAGLRKLHTGGANEPIFEEMARDMELPRDTYGAIAPTSSTLAAQKIVAEMPTTSTENEDMAEAMQLVFERARIAVAKANRRPRKARAA